MYVVLRIYQPPRTNNNRLLEHRFTRLDWFAAHRAGDVWARHQLSTSAADALVQAGQHGVRLALVQAHHTHLAFFGLL